MVANITYYTGYLRTIVSVSVVWFRRDLRLRDNPALNLAVSKGKPIICLFNLDLERIDRNDVDAIHLEWELDCLRDLSNEIQSIGGVLLFHYGDIIDKLNQIDEVMGIYRIFGNEETGLQWSWDRDKVVSKWCQDKSIEFHELPTNGVIRRLKSRDNWKRIRDSRMARQVIEQPKEISSPSVFQSDNIPSLHDLGITARSLQDRPEPGEKAALEVLISFLSNRGRNYRKDLSSPLTAKTACSRLSPYISIGCISIRQILHHAKKKAALVKENPRSKDNIGWTGSIGSFQSRLAWHCHFIQRLEDELSLDTIAMNPELDSHMNRTMDVEKFRAWSKGNTGWPFFDACMRSLLATGWINFRMRAMLQSVASYTLWLPWQVTGSYLARAFLDYEPGIHWSQVQMQSGVTGINTIRAYSISKQSLDQDPNGEFIRTWVNELRDLPDRLIHEPWKMTKSEQKQYNCSIGQDYPMPIVDEKSSRKEGISRSYSAKSQPDSKQRSRMVYEIHGSRKRRR